MRSPSDCVLKFLELPLTESMMSKIRDKNGASFEVTKSMAFNGQQNQALAHQAVPSVLMDTSNPLFTQIAILAQGFEDA